MNLPRKTDKELENLLRVPKILLVANAFNHATTNVTSKYRY